MGSRQQEMSVIIFGKAVTNWIRLTGSVSGSTCKSDKCKKHFVPEKLTAPGAKCFFFAFLFGNRYNKNNIDQGL